jgi:hypothetical protein
MDSVSRIMVDVDLGRKGVEKTELPEGFGKY